MNLPSLNSKFHIIFYLIRKKLDLTNLLSSYGVLKCFRKNIQHIFLPLQAKVIRFDSKIKTEKN